MLTLEKVRSASRVSFRSSIQLSTAAMIERSVAGGSTGGSGATTSLFLITRISRRFVSLICSFLRKENWVSRKRRRDGFHHLRTIPSKSAYRCNAPTASVLEVKPHLDPCISSLRPQTWPKRLSNCMLTARRVQFDLSFP